MQPGQQRGSYRCGMCAINFPVNQQFVRCPVCEERTGHVSNAEVHTDWLDRVMDAIMTISGGVPAAVPDEWGAYGEPPQEA